MREVDENIETWIPGIQAVSEQAATAILEVYQEKEYNVKSKLDSSPVTDADLRSDRIIQQGLKDMTPDIPIISEEAGMVPFEVRAQWPRCWLVDPLDGTRDFLKKTGEFCINIALIEKNVPVLGMIFVPISRHIYWAVRGGNAYFQKGGGTPQPIRCNPAYHQPVRVVGSREFRSCSRFAVLAERLGPYEIGYCGSAIKFGLIAKGEMDLYPRLSGTSEWDTAAGQCILEAAGGQVLDNTGTPLYYNARASLINPEFYAFSDPRLRSICCDNSVDNSV